MALSKSGVSQGDSVAVALPPSPALAIAHLGALKLGAVIVPLSALSDDTTLLQYALTHSTAKALIVDESCYGNCEALFTNLPNLTTRLVVRDLRPTAPSTGDKDFWSEVDRASSDFVAIETDACLPAFIFYVESHAEINGVVHSHRSVIGQLAAFEMFNDVQPEADSVVRSTGDWSSPAAVLGVLYPAWWYGCSVLAGTSDAGVQSVSLNQAYGRPETGWIFGQCKRWFATRSGSVGRPVPGRSIEIVDKNGNILPPEQTGHIAVHNSDPGLFTEYHRAAARTAASFIGDWFLTGDVGHKKEDGDLYISPSPSVVGTD